MSPDALPPIPTGLQAVLRACATDAALLERVVAHRAATAREAGFALTANEEAALEAVSVEQLRQMIAACPSAGAPLEGPGAPTRSDDREPTTGIPAEEVPQRPEGFGPRMGHVADVPRPSHAARPAGIRPDQIPRPIHNVVSRGIVPGHFVARRSPLRLLVLLLALGAVGACIYLIVSRFR